MSTFLLSGAAVAAETLEQAFREADFIVDWRLRYESVEQGGFVETANAVTNRLRAGLQTAPYLKTALQMEAIWVGDLVDDYNSTTNGQTQYPVIPDPADFSAINRFALINDSLPGTTLTVGRQRIILDDSRFVGNVGWRQNEQTFDGVRAQLGGPRLKADLTYASQVNRIFGPDSAAGRWEGDVVLANVAYTLPIGMLTMFDYFVDSDDAVAASSNTVGLRFMGSKALGTLAGSYALSYARQSDAGTNPASFSQNYYFVEGGLGAGKLGAALGYERLTGDGVHAFSAPLGTLHVFQGWADKFLATPAVGIEDRYVKLSYRMGPRGRFMNIDALAFLHDFVADHGTAHLGEELDVQLIARTQRFVLTLKYAGYRADEMWTDTDKLWLSVDYAL